MNSPQQQPGLLTVGNIVILAGDEMLRTTLLAVQYLAERQRRKHLSYPRQWDELAAALSAAMSDRPRADTAEPAALQADYMTTDELAAQLGCSPRQARRYAPRLDGQRIGGTWRIPVSAVTDHLEGLPS